MRSRPGADFVTAVKLYRLMRRERPQIVHTHLAKAGFVGRIAARLAGVPVVLHTFHGHVFHGYFSPSEDAALPAHGAVGGSSQHAHHHHQPGAAGGDCGVRGDRVLPTSRSSRSASTWRPSLRSLAARATSAARIGVPADAKLIGAVGRLVPIKNIPLLLRGGGNRSPAGSAASSSSSSVTASCDRSWRRRPRRWVSAESVTFAGWRRDLPNVYADLDAW